MELSTDIFVMGLDLDGTVSPIIDDVFTNIQDAFEVARALEDSEVFIAVVITVYGGDTVNNANLCYTTDFDINGNILRTES